MGTESRDGVSKCAAGGWLRLFFLLSVVSLLVPGGPLRSQQPPTISVNVKVVNVLATVRDKHGEIVPNLTKDDFMLEEDGHPQTIALFRARD